MRNCMLGCVVLIAMAGPAFSETEEPPKELAVDLGGGVKLDLVLIPAGSFTMGDDKFLGPSKPVHKVNITNSFYLGKCEVTQEQWEAVMGDNPSEFKGPKSPVVQVSWDDCQSFLRRLNERIGEQEGKFVLPTEAQWEYACRAGSDKQYCMGDDDDQLCEYAWCVGPGDVAKKGKKKGASEEKPIHQPHPVGEKKPNAWGLYDMHGNVWEWCADWYGAYGAEEVTDPGGPATGTHRVYRGGAWNCHTQRCRSAGRTFWKPDCGMNCLGLRVARISAKAVSESGLSESATKERNSAKEEPPLAVAPFDAAKAKEHQEAWAKHIGQPREVTNSIGMKLTLIPPGEFLMGSGESAEDTAAFFNKTYGGDVLRADNFKDEHPQHRVRITKPFYLGTYHVTRGQFRQFVADAGYKTDAEKGENPGTFGWNPDKKAFGFSEKYSWRNADFEQTDEHPVVNVSWNDAEAFCKWLSKKENKTYRLPTEAEWEYACRAGTTTRYSSGDDPETLAQVGNVADATAKAEFPDGTYAIKASDGYVFTAPVGKFKPNAFGLYDMHGNAWQWCADWYGAGYYVKSPADDPVGPDAGHGRVLRGGSCDGGSYSSRSVRRIGFTPDSQSYDAGFRVVRAQ